MEGLDATRRVTSAAPTSSTPTARARAGWPGTARSRPRQSTSPRFPLIDHALAGVPRCASHRARARRPPRAATRPARPSTASLPPRASTMPRRGRGAPAGERGRRPGASPSPTTGCATPSRPTRCRPPAASRARPPSSSRTRASHARIREPRSPRGPRRDGRGPRPRIRNPLGAIKAGAGDGRPPTPRRRISSGDPEEVERSTAWWGVFSTTRGPTAANPSILDVGRWSRDAPAHARNDLPPGVELTVDIPAELPTVRDGTRSTAAGATNLRATPARRWAAKAPSLPGGVCSSG